MAFIKYTALGERTKNKKIIPNIYLYNATYPMDFNSKIVKPDIIFLYERRKKKKNKLYSETLNV